MAKGTQRLLDALACIACALLLAVALVGAGFGACAAPPTTRLLADATDAYAKGPYDEAALTELACATRAYTIDARTPESAALLAEAVLSQAERAAAPGSPTASRWDADARAIALEGLASSTATARAAALAACGDRYALSPAMLSHLDDCNRLVAAATPWLLAGALGAAAAIAALAAMRRRRLLGMALVGAPATVLAAFAVLGLWGALDFNGLFAAFHGVLFPQGNWTFPSDSLLIAMYPLDFWVGMAGVWLGTTALLGIISLTIGIVLIRKKES